MATSVPMKAQRNNVAKAKGQAGTTPKKINFNCRGKLYGQNVMKECKQEDGNADISIHVEEGHIEFTQVA